MPVLTMVRGTRATALPEKFTVAAVLLLSLLKSMYLALVYVYDTHGRTVDSTLVWLENASKLADTSAPVFRCSPMFVVDVIVLIVSVGSLFLLSRSNRSTWPVSRWSSALPWAPTSY